RVRKITGIRKEVWNRDMRAAGVTEGRQAGAPTDDLAKTAGHANKRTTAKVYDRDRLEAARRVAKGRTAPRGNAEGTWCVVMHRSAEQIQRPTPGQCKRTVNLASPLIEKRRRVGSLEEAPGR